MRRLSILALFAFLSMPFTNVFAGIDASLDEQLNILAQGRVPERLIPGAAYRVAVVTYEDPDDTGLGDTVASLVAREVLTNSHVSSIGVIFFREGVSPSAESSLAYFDKVEKVTAAQDVKLAIWGVIRASGTGLEIRTFVQVPGPSVARHFTWRLRLPQAMGGQELGARLRPDRILVQRLLVDDSGLEQIRSAAESVAQVRENPGADARVTANLPMDEVYYLAERRGAWVRLVTRGGVDGWAPMRGHCTGQCRSLLDAAAYGGGLLRYMSDGSIPQATGDLTEEASAVSDQLQALGRLSSGSMRDLSRMGRVIRPWLKVGPVPPGGAAFANIDALRELSVALKEELLSRTQGSLQGEEFTRLYNQITLDKSATRSLAYRLARASLADPRNTDVLENLAVLFRYAGDTGRASLADSLARQQDLN